MRARHPCPLCGRRVDLPAQLGPLRREDGRFVATATIDTTAAKALTIGAQWGTNSASNTITCHHFGVEIG